MSSNSKGAKIIDALVARLATINIAAGYNYTIKGVQAKRTATMNTAPSELPMIEVIKADEPFKHEAGSSYWADTQFILWIVTERGWSDQNMEDLLQDIRRCLFGGSSNASGNTGITLGGLCTSIQLLDVIGDLNMVESNRVYNLRILVRSHRVTFQD